MAPEMAGPTLATRGQAMIQTSPDASATPQRIFETLLYGRVRADALRAAIELDIFSAIARGRGTADAIGAACHASPRGVTALCDFLTVEGYLTRSGDAYALGAEARTFLDRASPAYVGDVTDFFCAPLHVRAASELTAIVRRGGSTGTDVLEPDASEWQRFATSMVPVVGPAAAATARHLDIASLGPVRVLDVAASHGEFGIALARTNDACEVVGLDWPSVLEVARRRASDAGLAARYATIAGSVFDVDLAGPYDVILLPNFVHHFGPHTCETLFVKLRAALRPGGRLATIEFVPNDDRVTPPWPAMFGLTMLMTTPEGRTYTLAELVAMLERCGFTDNVGVALERTPETLVVSRVR
ncbi:MAG: hypothetical protein NVS2B3_12940 [Vulcanimicrobiaceae bacterium]